MGDIVLAGSTSGTTTLTPAAVSGTTTLTLPATTGTLVLAAAPTFTGQATIPTINLTGGQITFPATQSASADANTLDDYEQGTFTPTLTGTTQSAGTVSGRYTKIGNVVYVSILFSNVTLASSAGLAGIASLPFTVLNSTVSPSGVLGYNTTTAASANSGVFNPNTTSFSLYNSGTATDSAFANGAGKYLAMSGFYFTAD